MGIIDDFTIIFKKQIPVYQPGEAVLGSISLTVTERIKINSINLIANGVSKTEWNEGATKRGHIANRFITDTENYFSLKIFFETKPDDQDLFVEVGTWNYQFKVQLPEDLPTSFEHTNGYTRYSIKANVDIPWAIDKHVSKGFTVIHPVDLNSNPDLNQTYSASASKILCCGLFKKYPIIGTLNLSKIGYVAGQPIKFEAVLINNSSRSVKEMEFSLYQQVKLKALNQTKVKTFLRKVASVKSSKRIEPNSSYTWNDIELYIPATCPTINGMSNLIQINYGVVLNFDASGISLSTDLAIPIVIGTEPFLYDQSKSILSSISYEMSLLDYDKNKNDQSSEKPNDESDVEKFKPLYPFYACFQ